MTPLSTETRKSATGVTAPQPEKRRFPKIFGHIFWVAVAILGSWAFAVISQDHGEPVNSLWLVIASVCIYRIGYRFYAFPGGQGAGLGRSRACVVHFQLRWGTTADFGVN